MSRWQPGDRVAGRFVIEGWLASGGMAEVYVAEMTLARAVRRRVALKRIHTHLAEDPHFLTMFIDEARVASQLSHPGVVPVHDIVEDDGELLLVLDYVPGWDLGSILKSARAKGQRAPFGAAVMIGQAVSETLAYVHSAHDHAGTALCIVHRDVNPGNILIAEDGSTRLLDFGVAKAAERATQTATRSIKGKLGYLAPEQARAMIVDARTDLYGLGLALFELTAGRRALEADGDIALLELARAPEHVRASSLRPEVPAELDALIAHLLQVNPTARPKSAREVANALQGMRAVVPDSAPETVRAFVSEMMGRPARPIRAGRARLDLAFAMAAGLDPARPGTRPLAALGPAAEPDREPTMRELATAPDQTEPGETEPGITLRLRDGVSTTWVRDAQILGLATDLGAAQEDLPKTERAPAVVIAAAPRQSETRPEEPRLFRDSEPLAALQPRRRRPYAAATSLAILVTSGAVWAWTQADTAPVQPVAAPPPPVAPPAFLRITSDPAGAEIVLDGTPLGERTPAVVDSPAGVPRDVVLRLTDHVENATRAAAAQGEIAKVHLSLERLSGRLIVRSKPDGATVQIDRRDEGVTPLDLSGLARRRLHVRVERPGYLAHTTEIDLAARAEASIDVELERRVARGSLRVNSTPVWGKVYVDGKLVAESTPVVGLELAAGEHLVTVENPRLAVSAKKRVWIKEGKTESLIFELR